MQLIYNSSNVQMILRHPFPSDYKHSTIATSLSVSSPPYVQPLLSRCRSLHDMAAQFLTLRHFWEGDAMHACRFIHQLHHSPIWLESPLRLTGRLPLGKLPCDFARRRAGMIHRHTPQQATIASANAIHESLVHMSCSLRHLVHLGTTLGDEVILLVVQRDRIVPDAPADACNRWWRTRCDGC